MSVPDANDSKRVLYLQEINIKSTSKIKFDITLRNETETTSIPLHREKGAAIWRPSPSLELQDTSNYILTVTGDRKRDLFLRPEAPVKVAGQELMQKFWDGESSLNVESTFHNHPLTATLLFYPSTTSEITRTAVRNLQKAMETYRLLMSDSTQQRIGQALAVGELNPIAKAAFGVAKKTFELLQEQQKHDAMVPELAKRINDILPFADAAVGDSIDNGNMDLLVKAAEELYRLVEETACFIQDYVKRSPGYRVVKSLGSPEDHMKIEELTDKFTTMKEDFDRALNVEAFKKTREIENKIILKRLEPTTRAGYDEVRKCMEGTRTDVLDDIMNWATESPPPDHPSKTEGILWLHGTPGLGKTTIANSICSLLHEKGRLGGSFFCRRDDPVLCEPKYVLPALIYKLAEMWAPYRKLVAQALENDPQLDPGTPSQLLSKLLLAPFDSMQTYPPSPLVIVMDALDECGNASTRMMLLDGLFKVITRGSWLKIVITSRPERDIQSFFHRAELSSRHVAHDLVQAQAVKDIQFFTKQRLAQIAINCELPSSWPGEKKVVEIVALSGGLFLFVETLYKLLDNTIDPEDTLARVLGEDSHEASRGLDELYQRAIELVVGMKSEDRRVFRTIAGAIIAVASYRALGDDSLAALLGLRPSVVKALVNKLSSLLHRDGARGEIRVRHLSIIEFLKKPSTHPDFRVDLKATNEELGTSCLKTMIKELRFNICQLETSSRLNSEIEDLENRISLYITDALQYGCVYWWNHVCSGSDPSSGVKDLLEKLLSSEKVLYWMEVLSLLGKVPIALPSLRQLKGWLKNPQDLCQELAADALRFVTAFFTPITMSCPHIYVSALPFSPTKCQLWSNTKDSFQNLLDVYEGRQKTWQARPHIWRGHTEWICTVAWSPDGLHVVSGSGDNTIRIWDAETGQQVGGPLSGHTDSVNGVAYSPDGSQIVSCSRDMTICIWDAETRQQVGKPLTGHTHQVSCVAYSPDGSQIVSGSWDETIRIWDAKIGKQVGEFLTGHTNAVKSVAYSPDGTQIVSGFRDGTICIWDAETGQQMGKPLIGHSSQVQSVAYSPDGSKIISGSWDETICIWDAKTGKEVGEPLTGHAKPVTCVAYSLDGNQIISSSFDHTICIWDVKTRQKVCEPLTGHTNAVNCVAYSPDGSQIVSGSWDETIRIWNAKTGKEVGELLTGHTNAVKSVAYSPDGTHIVSGFRDGTICIWNAETGQQVGKPLIGHTDMIFSVTYSPDGSQIISGSSDHTLCIWDAGTGQQVGEALRGHTDPVICVAYSPDGSRIVSGSADYTISIWDAKTGQQMYKSPIPYTGPVGSVTYSPDGSWIVASFGNIIGILDAKTGEKVGNPLIGHTETVLCAVYSPDGSRIVSGSRDNTICIWDAKIGQKVGEPLTGHTKPVSSVAYSPDGTQIVSGSWDDTICIWDAKTGQQEGEILTGHTKAVNSVAYSPDGSRIISGSQDGTIRIWDAKVKQQGGEPSTKLDLKLDVNGWVYYQGELVFWLPEDCRNGFLCPALFTIPATGHSRCVRVDTSQMRYGNLWTEIWHTHRKK